MVKRRKSRDASVSEATRKSTRIRDKPTPTKSKEGKRSASSVTRSSPSARSTRSDARTKKSKRTPSSFQWKSVKYKYRQNDFIFDKPVWNMEDSDIYVCSPMHLYQASSVY